MKHQGPVPVTLPFLNIAYICGCCLCTKCPLSTSFRWSTFECLYTFNAQCVQSMNMWEEVQRPVNLVQQ